MAAATKTFWITGASTGIGRELALRLASQGHSVLVSARSADRLDALSADAKDIEGSIAPFALDVTDLDAVHATLEQIIQHHGCPDTVVLNAGFYRSSAGKDFRSAELQAHLAVNVIGVGNVLDAVVPHFVERQGGHIAIVASIAGYRGLPNAAAYGASKAALINLAESLRLDLQPLNIKVQLINPGFVKTPMTDANEFKMPFLMSAEDAARRLDEGLRSSRFEVTFPRRFTWQLKLLRLLPYSLYFKIVSARTGSGR